MKPPKKVLIAVLVITLALILLVAVNAAGGGYLDALHGNLLHSE